MGGITQWKHYKQNYLATSLIMVALFLTTLLFEIFRDSESWWFSLFFLTIGIVIIPIGNYFSWKKKFK